MNPTDKLPTHHFDTCNACLSTFFTSVQLTDVVDVPAILSEPQLRKSVVNFYQAAVQYIPWASVLLLMSRLALKATWDESFKERAFEKCFNALDWFTARSAFPRKGEVTEGFATSNVDVRKRRKLEPKLMYTSNSM